MYSYPEVEHHRYIQYSLKNMKGFITKNWSFGSKDRHLYLRPFTPE